MRGCVCGSLVPRSGRAAAPLGPRFERRSRRPRRNRRHRPPGRRRRPSAPGLPERSADPASSIRLALTSARTQTSAPGSALQEAGEDVSPSLRRRRSALLPRPSEPMPAAHRQTPASIVPPRTVRRVRRKTPQNRSEIRPFGLHFETLRLQSRATIDAPPPPMYATRMICVGPDSVRPRPVGRPAQIHRRRRRPHALRLFQHRSHPPKELREPRCFPRRKERPRSLCPSAQSALTWFGSACSAQASE